MRFPRYSKHKDSGVEWLGQVPMHWRVVPVGHVSSIVNGYPFDSGLFDASDGFPLVRIRDLDSLETETRYRGEFVPSASVTAADVLIGMDGDFNVGRWLGSGPALLNQRLCCVRGQTELVTRLLEYLLPYPLKVIHETTFSTTVKHLSSSQVEKTKVVLPIEEGEQRAVLAFLDSEVAKISAMIGENTHLIELLTEKRESVISHAITKGLNPQAGMTSSGVESLGEVPAHWQIMPLARLTPDDRPIMYGIVLPGPDVDDGVPIVKGGDVKPGRLRLDLLNRTTTAIESAYARSRLKGGDIVYSIRGSIGEAELVPDELTGANLTQDAARVAPRDGVHGPWLLNALKSHCVFSQLDAKAGGATIRGINIFDLKRARIPTPPADEQRAIAAFLTRVSDESDALMVEAQRGISLLRERRLALISDAVTGKIDVRGLVAAAT